MAENVQVKEHISQVHEEKSVISRSYRGRDVRKMMAADMSHIQHLEGFFLFENAHNLLGAAGLKQKSK